MTDKDRSTTGEASRTREKEKKEASDVSDHSAGEKGLSG